MDRLDPWTAQELRGGWLGVPQPFTPLDAMGVGFGGYFAWSGYRYRDTLMFAVGCLMIGIHLNRFLYAPQDWEGLERLLQSLGLSWSDVCPP